MASRTDLVAAATATPATAEPAAEQKDPLHVLATQAIERQKVVLEQLLPRHMDIGHFEQMTLATVKANPKLLNCFATQAGRVSLLYGVVSAASAGLDIGPISKEAWLIPYQESFKDENNRWAKRWVARLQISDRGVRDLARRDPQVKELVAGVVRDGDHFIHRRGLEGDLFEHEVRGPSTRELTHAYCLIRWVAGGALPIVMDREDVLYIRDNYSDAWKGELDKEADRRTNPWAKREWTMWMKTAIHQAIKELDLTPAVVAALDNDAEDPIPEVVEAAMLQVETPDLPAIDAGVEELEHPPADEDGEPWDRPAPGAIETTTGVGPVSDAYTYDMVMAAAVAANLIPASAKEVPARKALHGIINEALGEQVPLIDEAITQRGPEIVAYIATQKGAE